MAVKQEMVNSLMQNEHDSMKMQRMSWNRIYKGSVVAGCVLPERNSHYIVFMNDAPNPQAADGPYLLRHTKDGVWVGLDGEAVTMPGNYMYQKFFHPRYNSIEDKYYA